MPPKKMPCTARSMPPNEFNIMELEKRTLMAYFTRRCSTLSESTVTRPEMGSGQRQDGAWDEDPIRTALEMMRQEHPAEFAEACRWITGLGELADRCTVRDLLMCMLRFVPADELPGLMSTIVGTFIKSNVLLSDEGEKPHPVRVFAEHGSRYKKVSESFDDFDEDFGFVMAAMWAAVFRSCFPDHTRYAVLVTVGSNLAALRAAHSPELETATRDLLRPLFTEAVAADESLEELFEAAMDGDDGVVGSSALCDRAYKTVVFLQLDDDVDLPAELMIPGDGDDDDDDDEDEDD
jgi:hypothetical protein